LSAVNSNRRQTTSRFDNPAQRRVGRCRARRGGGP